MTLAELRAKTIQVTSRVGFFNLLDPTQEGECFRFTLPGERAVEILIDPNEVCLDTPVETARALLDHVTRRYFYTRSKGDLEALIPRLEAVEREQEFLRLLLAEEDLMEKLRALQQRGLLFAHCMTKAIEEELGL